MIHKESSDDTATADIAIVGAGMSGLAFAAICEAKGLDYVLYERSKKETPPRGGCLDLHVGSGQRAMKAAGVFAEFKKYARTGDSTIHKVYDRDMNYYFAFGEGRDSPEIDRHEIKKSLLSGISDENVEWRKSLESSTRNERGQIALNFTDGTSVSGFKLVVGADGTFSKVRPLITSISPEYWGVIFFTSEISQSNPFHPTLYKRAGTGPMIVLGRKTKIWCQLQGSGSYRVDFGFMKPADFATNGPVDLKDTESVKRLLLSDEFFGHHDQLIKDMLIAMDGPFRDWPMWSMPVEALDWSPSADVTLIGDSAHTTTPFIGDGANCAMRDAVLLAEEIKKSGFGKEGIGAYEKQMFEFAIPMITNSTMSGNLFFAEDAPKSLTDMMKQHEFIGASDNY